MWTGGVNVARNYTVNGLNQYLSAGPATFTHDANGNLTTDGTSAYVYDAENRLVSSSASGGATLSYDPLGRLWKIWSQQTGTTSFVYEGDHVSAEYDWAGNMLRRYFWGPGADEPIIQDEGGALNCGGTRFLHANHQGSIIAASNCDGNLTAINRYDEYGIPQGNWGRFQYTGQAWLPELGMYYYKARIYSATLGRFLQTDPIGYDDQVNLYAYVGNDPVNRTDPQGTDSVWVYPDKVIIVVPVVNQSHLPDSAVLKGFQISGKTSDGVSVVTTAAMARRVDSVSVSTNPSLKRSNTDSIGGRIINLRSSAGENTVRHEAGHTMGAGDQYKGGVTANGEVLKSSVPGSADSLMGGDTGQTRPPNTQTMNEIRDQAISSPRNTVHICKAGQKPSTC